MRLALFFMSLLVLLKGSAQDFELRTTPFIPSKIVYTDSTSEKGHLRLASSVFKLRLKKHENDKERKIDYEKVEKIITNPDTRNERVFQYLNQNYNRFKIFVELVHSDIINIYISSTDADDLFYSDFDRQSIQEKLAEVRFEGTTGFMHRLKASDTLELVNGRKLVLPIRYSYYYNCQYAFASGQTPTLQYYILKEGGSELVKVEKNKRFLKRSKGVFDHCPRLVTELTEKRIDVRDIPSFIEHYKLFCSDSPTGKEKVSSEGLDSNQDLN